MHPTNRLGLATRVTLPETDIPLSRAAVVALLSARAADGVRRFFSPAVRGRGVRQSTRLHDAKRGRAYALSNWSAVLAEAICDLRIPTAALCDWLAAIALEVRVLRGEALQAPDLCSALANETRAQGDADVLQLVALGSRSPGDLQALLDHLHRHRDALDTAVLATRAELDRVARFALAS